MDLVSLDTCDVSSYSAKYHFQLCGIVGSLIDTYKEIVFKTNFLKSTNVLYEYPSLADILLMKTIILGSTILNGLD